MVSDRDEGEEVFRRIDRVSRTFLETPLELAGIVPFDPAVRAAVKRREPFVLAAPDCPASIAVRAIARGLAASLGRDAREAERAAVDATLASPGRRAAPEVVDPRAFASARASFLGRLTAWLARR
jgi:MinD-like ATPase involved in chromosome partitioning or flagellar assembly